MKSEIRKTLRYYIILSNKYNRTIFRHCKIEHHPYFMYNKVCNMYLKEIDQYPNPDAFNDLIIKLKKENIKLSKRYHLFLNMIEVMEQIRDLEKINPKMYKDIITLFEPETDFNFVPPELVKILQTTDLGDELYHLLK